MPNTNISPEERGARVSSLLRQVDEDVRVKNFEAALDKIRMVYNYDIKNIYARAYEERILVMMVERDREQVVREVEAKAAEKIDAEVKKRLKDFYRQQENDAEKRRQAEIKEHTLEDRARKASVSEVKQETSKDISVIEKETTKRFEELEQKLLSRLQQSQMPTTQVSSASVEKLRNEYEVKLMQLKQQYEATESERKKIQGEAFAKLNEEHERAQEQLIQRMEQELNTLLEREREKEKERAHETYRAAMTLMLELAVPAEVQASLLQTLKIGFSISDTDHKIIEREVQVRAYIETVRILYQSAQQSEEDLTHLKNLRKLFQISEDEHVSILKRVKKDLGLPDETAVIIVIDDDPAIRKYVEHILKRTYQTVLTAVNAESAIPEIQKTYPALIISDVNLGTGVMSGFTFCEKIRSGELGEEIKTIPVILISALEDEFFIKSAKQLGVKKYLSKPFTREILEATVKEALA